MRSSTQLPHPPLDRVEALRRLENDKELFVELVDAFIEREREMLGDGPALWRAGNVSELKQYAHRVRGLALTFSATPSSISAASLEQACAEQVDAKIEQALAKLIPDLSALFAELKVVSRELRS